MEHFISRNIYYKQNARTTHSKCLLCQSLFFYYCLCLLQLFPEKSTNESHLYTWAESPSQSFKAQLRQGDYSFSLGYKNDEGTITLNNLSVLGKPKSSLTTAWTVLEISLRCSGRLQDMDPDLCALCHRWPDLLGPAKTPLALVTWNHLLTYPVLCSLKHFGTWWFPWTQGLGHPAAIADTASPTLQWLSLRLATHSQLSLLLNSL